ncbi:MAG: hypothetical protein FWC80_01410 [Firmicutes bacterium]|nr:hypothetical protein [Bacillota bacterium]
MKEGLFQENISFHYNKLLNALYMFASPFEIQRNHCLYSPTYIGRDIYENFEDTNIDIFADDLVESGKISREVKEEVNIIFTNFSRAWKNINWSTHGVSKEHFWEEQRKQALSILEKLKEPLRIPADYEVIDGD